MHFGFYNRPLANLDPAQNVGDRFTVDGNVDFNSSGAMRYPLNNITDQTEAGIYNLELRVRCLVNVEDANFNNLKHGVFANLAPYERYTNCSFTNCHRGVTTANQNDSYDFRIRQSNFTACNVGVQASNTSILMQENTITHNDIMDLNIGVIVRGCEYQIGGQTRALGNNFSNNSLGILLIENGAWNGVVRNNMLTNTWVGILAAGNNSESQISCNGIVNYEPYGLGLIDWNVQSNGVLPQQGNCILDKPAGNIFQGNGFLTDIFKSDFAMGFDYHDINTLNLTTSPQINLQECNYQGNLNLLCDVALARVPINDIPNLGSISAKNIAAAEWYRYYMALDEIENAVNVLELTDTDVTKRKLIPYKLEEGALPEVAQILNSLPINTQSEQDFYDVHQILLSLALNGKDTHQVTATQHADLQSIAQHTTKTAYKAQTLLYMIDRELHPLRFPSWNFLHFNSSSKRAGSFVDNELLQVIPNPIMKEGRIQYQLTEEQVGILEIYDVNGQLLQRAKVNGVGSYVIDVKALSNGLYFSRLSINGKTIARQKFVVTQ